MNVQFDTEVHLPLNFTVCVCVCVCVCVYIYIYIYTHTCSQRRDSGRGKEIIIWDGSECRVQRKSFPVPFWARGL